MSRKLIYYKKSNEKINENMSAFIVSKIKKRIK